MKTTPLLRRPTRPRSAALVSVTALALTLAGAGQAQATILKLGSNQAEATQYCARAYDGESDGNGVYADVVFDNDVHASTWDNGGADNTWGPWTCGDTRIARFRVCEDHSSCPDDWFWWPA